MKKKARLTGMALSLSLSEWSRLQHRAIMKSRFPTATARQLDDRMYEHLCELEGIRQRAIVKVPRKAR